MSHICIIEIAGQAMGLVVRQDETEAYRFHAAVDRAYPFDGQIFATPEAARQALRQAALGPPQSGKRAVRTAA